MKIQLILSGTYLHNGKVYQRKDNTGKAVTYTVPRVTGEHLLAQRSERDIPYFRLLDDAAPAVVPATKRIEKGGVLTPEPIPEDIASDDAAPAEAALEDDAVSADDMNEEGDDEEAVSL
jgi:hypothetical protein